MAIRASIHDGNARALGGFVTMDCAACVDLHLETRAYRLIVFVESYVVGGVDSQVGSAAIFRGRVVVDFHSRSENSIEALPVVRRPPQTASLW